MSCSGMYYNLSELTYTEPVVYRIFRNPKFGILSS